MENRTVSTAKQYAEVPIIPKTVHCTINTPEGEELISENCLNGWSENLSTYGSQWHHRAQSLTWQNQK